MSPEVQAAKPVIDLARYELTVDGTRAKLERQPMELLILFVQRRGQLVSREEIVDRLWGKDVFVDSDRSINAAVRKIRSALKDDPAEPKYLETVIGKGYRFIGDLAVIEPQPAVAAPADPKSPTSPPQLRRMLPIVLISAAILAVGTWAALHRFGAPSRDSIRSIAVLPLTNLSGDPSQDYFADGLTEELTTDLGKIHALKVISRTSAQRYRASNKSAPQIAQDLKVDAIVEGSVLRAANKVRITVQLIDAVHDRHLWAESYERDIRDVLAAQNTAALEIARQIRIRLTPAEQQRFEHHTPVHPEAYDAYLRGRYSQTTQSPERLKDGLAAFHQAVSLDPGYAPAYAGLSDTYSLLANYSVIPAAEAFPLAIAAAKKSLALDPMLADAHVAAAWPAHHFTWDWAAAEREYKTAISLDPASPNAHYRYAEYLSSVARHDEAIAEMHRALDLDPLSLVYAANLGRFLYHARRYEEAIEIQNQVLALDPHRDYARVNLALSYVEKGMFDQASSEISKAEAALGGPLFVAAHLYARSGHPAKAAEILRRLRRQTDASGWFFLAGAYAALPDKNTAFLCLEKAFEKHDFFLVFLKVHPYMDPLRSDPRYAELLHRIGLDAVKP